MGRKFLSQVSFSTTGGKASSLVVKVFKGSKGNNGNNGAKGPREAKEAKEETVAQAIKELTTFGETAIVLNHINLINTDTLIL